MSHLVTAPMRPGQVEMVEEELARFRATQEERVREQVTRQR
jgi:hypothetical protein